MLQHFQDLMLTIFILLVLEHFLYCNFLTCGSIDTKVYNPKSALACYSFDLELACRCLWFMLLRVGQIDLRALVGLCSHVFLEA